MDKYDFENEEISMNQRIYFNEWDDIYRHLAEKFTYLSMSWRKGEAAGERPFFGFDQKTKGEQDFYARGYKSRKKMGLRSRKVRILEKLPAGFCRIREFIFCIILGWIHREVRQIR